MATQQNVQNKQKRPNIFKRFGAWVGRSWSEFKKVNWPSFSTVMKNLAVVLVVVAFFLVVIGGFDSFLSWLLRLLTNTNNPTT